ncbi:hypothetical protein KCH_04470 [Kitasatospora cheerisanensis KCTC 2395]|uniref:Uncharacterized protein n=1 Tax=Kitasatospora cheerisanensis KCTC 2395 TaxID=1348663 RepID=A0A066ZCE2_9ACTN|nr:hypothetical protein KCH_04470 [Kitasatospora cheerisanensis KCTC 2395]
MNAWVDLGALAKIVLAGLLTGAGLPALFACALWLLNPAGPSPTARAPGRPPARRAARWPDWSSPWCSRRSAGASPSSSTGVDRSRPGPTRAGRLPRRTSV